MLRKLTIIGIIALFSGGMAYSNWAQAAEKDAKPEKKLAESSSRFSDKVPGLKEQDDLPKGPRPLFELGQGYLEEGPYDYEFELPWGMVVSPGLVFFGNFNTGLEVTDNGVADATAELVTTLNLFANLTLSGTERILVGVSPLQRENGPKSRYQFQPDSDWKGEANLRLTTAFFEGELSEMFPKLDMDGRLPLDYNISVGRQGLRIQDGIMIQDTMDSIAVTRSTLPLPGTNFARFTGFMAWNNVHRTNNKDDADGELYGLSASVEVAHAMIDLNMAYVDSSDAIGDQFNIGASMVRPYILFEHSVDTTTHIAFSHTPDAETVHATDGALLYTSLSWAPKRTVDIMYVNAFAAFDQYAPAARQTAGPLGITGLLFAGNGLAGAAIGNRANDAYGGAIGYQMFFSPALRRNLIFELGGKKDDSEGGIDRVGGAVRYSQAVGRRTFFEIGGFVVGQESIDDAYGIRTKLSFIF
jgi:hypothetical protein